MHQKLSKSPITYMLAQVRFTNVESIEKFIPEIQEKIRHDFPIFKNVPVHAFEIRDNKQPPVSTTIQQWHFMDKDSVTGILLDGKSITIHTTKYDQFDNLSSKLKKVLININDIINISLFVRLGVRYINSIDSNLDQYVKRQLLGFHLENKPFDKNKYYSNTDLIQKSDRGLIRIRSTIVGNDEVIPGVMNLPVPLELFNSANHLSFSHHKRPKNNFLMLDIDHSDTSQSDFEVKKIISILDDLHDAAYQAFQEIITKEALESWR